MRKKHLVAEFAEKTEEERSKRFSKWRFLLDVKNNLTTKAFQKIEKTEKNSFFIKHGYAHQLRNIEKGDTVAYYQNRRSPGSNDRKKRGDGWKNRKKTSSRVKT